MIIVTEHPIDFKSERYCPVCGDILSSRGSRRRKIRYYENDCEVIRVRRFHCDNCGSNHTELPDILYQNKHYSRSIIDDVLSGAVTERDELTLYGPSPQTIKRWRITFCRY